MAQLIELNNSAPFKEQLNSNEEGSVVLINVFTLDASDEQAMLDAWKSDAQFMKTQPGYISTQLHKAIGHSPTFINYAVWESLSDFRNAFTHPEFQSRIQRYPGSVTISPHLFKTFSVPGVCVA